MPSKRQVARAGKFPNGGPAGNQKAKGNPGGGRIGPYNPKHHPKQARKYLLLDKDMTYATLADLFNVTEDIIKKWVLRYPEFRHQIQQGRIGEDAKVGSKLYSSAKGYSHPHETVKFEKDAICPICKGKVDYDPNCEHCAGTGMGRIIRIKQIKYYPPSVDAAKFILTNRHPDKWSRDPDVVVDNSTGEQIPVDDLPLELRKQLFEHMQQKKKEAAAAGGNDSANSNRRGKRK